MLSGSLADAEGRTVPLHDGDVDLEPLDYWTSLRTGGRYPVAWRLRLPDHGLDLRIAPLLPDQENTGERSGVIYWEGAVTVTDAAGRPAGEGYVEMTGYAPGGHGLP